MAPFLAAMILLGLSTASHAKLTSGKKKLTPAKAAKTCDRTAHQLKNCDLEIDDYTIRIWKQTMSVSDKVSRSLTTLPLTGEKVEWVLGRVEKLGSDYFVEWVAWEEPAATSQIQTKMWYVYRLKKETAELVLSHPIVKRLKVDGGKPKSDDETDFGLKLEKKTPVWFAGKDKGVLK